MSVKEMTKVALLATLLFMIYSMGSMVMYVELFNFTVLLYGVSLTRRQSFGAVLIFSCLLVLVYGVQIWTLMYVLVFPTYTLVYHQVGKWTHSEYVLASVGFILAFLCGTLIDLPFMLIIDLPFMLMSGLTSKALIIRLILGFQVSLGNGICTFLATLFLFPSLSKLLTKLNKNGTQ